jgi:hypothetical protein
MFHFAPLPAVRAVATLAVALAGSRESRSRRTRLPERVS